MEASWDPLGTILGDFRPNFGNFLATCLASRFGIDFLCFFTAFKPSFFDSRRSENSILTFSSGSMLASILASKTFPKWTQNGPKTVSRGSQRLLKKSLKNACFSEHGPQEGSQEASKINQKWQNYRLSLELALGRPSGPQKVSKNDPKMVQNHPN